MKIVNPLRGWNWTKRERAVFVFCASITSALPAQTFTTLHSFDFTDGATPTAGPIQYTNGELYGTTLSGAAGNVAGTVFKITLSGSLTTVYGFCAQNACPDGYHPYAGVVQAKNGNLYGTTFTGGATATGGIAVGTVFQVTPSGTLTTLYNFCSLSRCADGVNPTAGLIQATNGDLYGTTTYGGTNGNVVSKSFITAIVPSVATSGTVQVVTPRGTLSSNVPFRVLP